MSFELYNHQKKGVELLTEHDSFGLFWDMGSGKTLTMLMHLSNLVLSGEVATILWLAPKSALGAVPRDLATLRKGGLNYRADALENAITLMNYEKLSRKDSKFRKEVESTKWDALVLDEAHCICRPQSNRTKYIVGMKKCTGLASKVKYRYVMTGTPVGNSRLEDFWSFLRVMYKNDYSTFGDFERMYCQYRYLPGTYIKIYTGYANVNELLDEVSSFSQSITKEECLDLPECMPDDVIEVELGKEEHKRYKMMLEESVMKCEDGWEVADNALVRMLRLRQIASSKEKTAIALELIENNPHKTVVFYEFTSTFEQLTKALDNAKIPYMYLNGDQQDKNIWLKFQEKSDSECRVFISQYRSGNAGIDLYTASDTIFMEPTPSSTVLNQARSRTHRNGVSRGCTFTFLLTKDTVEEDMYEALRKHEDFNERLWFELKSKE